MTSVPSRCKVTCACAPGRSVGGGASVGIVNPCKLEICLTRLSSGAGTGLAAVGGIVVAVKLKLCQPRLISDWVFNCST